MSKKHFIALADMIRKINSADAVAYELFSIRRTFSEVQINLLADFCQSQNKHFDREKWIDYINK
jgi:hypothetical protein